MSHADRMIAEAEALWAQALEAGNATEARECETRIARWKRIRARVDAAPPLDAAQRDRLAVLLRPAPAETAPQATPRRAAA